MSENPSQNETIRKSISDALDNKKNLNDITEKKNLIQSIKKDYPDFAEKSINTTFSKYLKSESGKRGIKPKDAKSKPAFNPSMKVTVNGNPTSPKVENPLAIKDNNKKLELPKSNIPASICESTGNTCYSFIRLHDSDMEDLTTQERKDLGEIIKYMADTFGGGEKFQAFLMLTGFIGIMVSKKRKAMNKRKDTKKELETQKTKEPKLIES